MNKLFKYVLTTGLVLTIAACTGNPTKTNGSDVEQVSSQTTQPVVVDTAAEARKKAEAERIKRANDARTAALNTLAQLDNVFYFEFDSSKLKPQARETLNQFAAALRVAPKNIRLEGHADERGTREYNIALGERRAKAVQQYLVAQGVSAQLIETVSYGEERPANRGNTEAAQAQNRRVVLN